MSHESLQQCCCYHFRMHAHLDQRSHLVAPCSPAFPFALSDILLLGTLHFWTRDQVISGLLLPPPYSRRAFLCLRRVSLHYNISRRCRDSADVYLPSRLGKCRRFLTCLSSRTIPTDTWPGSRVYMKKASFAPPACIRNEGVFQ